MKRQQMTEMENPYSDLGELKSVDLISFAYQIASGMVRLVLIYKQIFSSVHTLCIC